mmetsp:Transcript_42595/g.92804  ORF Transcript_42595/g.92804 Transcript_42595/m.92804 type:complete len:573 (-) Transcript_42595:175-1893(-)|eukprot:CAMPEP_0170583782 /NCGR_PEP_ID=MMETSP0224-20130122/8328_1 /TAXON_ID=285029 /ORGANISM="Togula jolla, Strain CCCM 725" /LENGTH=572 /DNA_ID=CAMNT_0010907151 /DNA_START=37 /DNA_END=1755 /DNA_ORIENTATION=+
MAAVSALHFVDIPVPDSDDDDLCSPPDAASPVSTSHATSPEAPEARHRSIGRPGALGVASVAKAMSWDKGYEPRSSTYTDVRLKGPMQPPSFQVPGRTTLLYSAEMRAPAQAPAQVLGPAVPVASQASAPAPMLAQATAPAAAMSQNPVPFAMHPLDCLLGPKQQQKVLLQKQAANDKLKAAVLYWADLWDEYLEEHPELHGAEREHLKACFDEMQAAAMCADGEHKLTKAHFSAVMYHLRTSGRSRDAKGRKEARRRRPPPSTVKHLASRWESYVKLHPELIGASRDAMKHGFNDMLEQEEPGSAAKSHFSLVMNFLRLSGRRDIGAWDNYMPPPSAGKLGQAKIATARAATVGEIEDEAGDEEMGEDVTLPAGLLIGMEEERAADFDADMWTLRSKTGVDVVEVQWEESRIYLGGTARTVIAARNELKQVLSFYFPQHFVSEPPSDIGRAGDESEPAASPSAQRHWSENVKCNLSQRQRQKTLTRTQEAREKQRGAAKHWADRWEEWVKLHPELIGAERAIMKAGFDAMQLAELGTAPKVHFSTVMNFLRNSGRRTIGAWKDYKPQGWTG